MLANSRVTTRPVVSANVRHENGWSVHMDILIDGARATRELEASSCAALAEAAALIIAVSIDPGLALSADPGPETTSSSQEGAAAPDASDAATPLVPSADAPPPPEEKAKRETAWKPLAWGLHAGTSTSFGLTPSPAVGFHGGVFGAAGRMSARIDGHTLLPADAGDDASFRALRLRAELCAQVVTVGRAHVSPCAGLETNVLWGEARGVSHPRSATAVFLAPLLGGRVTVGVTRWLFVGAGVDGALALQRPEFELAQRPIFRVAPVLGSVHIEASVRF
jgi:hypothetical protein